MSQNIFRKDGTAQGVAKQRWIESLAKPEKRLIYDPYAKYFVAGSGLIKLMGHRFSVWITKKFAPGFHEHLISRTRFIDDLIKKSVADGTKQYVILGAGYDLRAHRLNLPSDVQIFEVDQPEVQKKKRAKLPQTLADSENVIYVGIDFNHQSLKDQLLMAGFDSSKNAIFTLEGVSQYIPKETVRSTLAELKELTNHANTTFFISYVDQLLLDEPTACFGKGYARAASKAKTVMSLAAKAGEPWVSFYTANEMEALLYQHGFVLNENKTLGDLNLTYFAPVGRKLSEHEIFKLEHFVVARNFK